MNKKSRHRSSVRKTDVGRQAMDRPSSRVILQKGPAKGSVRSLQELYTVAVGVALVKAMEVFVGGKAIAGGQSNVWANWGALWAFVATLVPFYHGAMRHLDKTYIEDQGAFVRRGALLSDFLLLFIEAGILLGMALHLAELERFVLWLAVLLVFDSVWGVVVLIILTTKPRGWPEFKWAIVNVPTALALGAVLLVADRIGTTQDSTVLIVMAPSLAIIRTVIDYAWSWSFYFPAEPAAD